MSDLRRTTISRSRSSRRGRKSKPIDVNQRLRQLGIDPQLFFESIEHQAVSVARLLPATHEDFSVVDLIRGAAVEYFGYCMRSLPHSIGIPDEKSVDLGPHYLVPGDVLTKWRLKRPFVGEDGKSLALTASGKGTTFASLVRSINPHADWRIILAFLIQIRAVRQVGKRYIPLARFARHIHSQRYLRIQSFLASLGLQRTLERNIREQRPDPTNRLFQFTSDGSIPRGRRAAYRRGIRSLGEQTLSVAEAMLFRENLARKRGAPSLPVSVGLYLSEGGPLPSLIRKKGWKPGGGRI